jgi:glutamate dehydrogenase (NAD(P)+)
MDDGKINNYHAYRIQYNYARGPAKGGIRMKPSTRYGRLLPG